MNNYNYIYVMKCEHYMKIGMASNFENRLAAISCCTPFEVSILDTFELDDKVSASVAEKLCHDELKKANYHKKLEWFHLTEESLKIVKQCVEIVRKGKFKILRRQLLDLKKIIKKSKLMTMSATCDYLDGIGFKSESKLLRRSYEGPYCTFHLDETGVKALYDYVKITAIDTEITSYCMEDEK